jgi:hypothetical protein
LDKPPYAVLETTGSKANRLSSQETSSWKSPVLPITEASI